MCPLLLSLALLVSQAPTETPPLVAPPPLKWNRNQGTQYDYGPGVDIDIYAKTVTRHDSTGQLLWKVQSDRVYGCTVRPPGDAHDTERIYLADRDGVTALNLETGKVEWHANGPNHRLHLSGNLLLAVERRGFRNEAKSWLIARDVRTGTPSFRIAIEDDFDFSPIQELTGLFLVQVPHWRFPSCGPWVAFLIDHTGKILYRCPAQIYDGRRYGEERVFLTQKGLVRVSADGRELWETSFKRFDIGGFALRTTLIDVPGGDLLAYRYRCNLDSDVEITRFDPKTGTTRWAGKCVGFHKVNRDKYFQVVTVAVEGERLRVTSQGYDGSFVEFIDLKTGESLQRAERFAD